jgi:hypothetical protein
MNIVNGIIEVLKYILPSLVVFLTTWFLASRYFKSEDAKRTQQLALNNQNLITPLRLQAYERIVLYLERINPENLVMRLSKPGLTSQQLQNELLITIRAEYEHNLTQQIYISNKAWEMLKNARNATIQLINVTAENLNKEEPSINLSKAILEKMRKEEKNPASDAIVYIKKEINSLY